MVTSGYLSRQQQSRDTSVSGTLSRMTQLC